MSDPGEPITPSEMSKQHQQHSLMNIWGRHLLCWDVNGSREKCLFLQTVGNPYIWVKRPVPWKSSIPLVFKLGCICNFPPFPGQDSFFYLPSNKECSRHSLVLIQDTFLFGPVVREMLTTGSLCIASWILILIHVSTGISSHFLIS